MFRLFAWILLIMFLSFVIPVKIFLIAVLGLLMLVILIFVLFHLGVQDFQGY